MRRLFIILILCFAGLAAISQTIPALPTAGTPTVSPPVAPPNAGNQLSNYERKLKAHRDSVLNAGNRYIKAGPRSSRAALAKDSLPHGPKGLATVREEADPVHLFPSLDRTSCKSLVFMPVAPAMADVALPPGPKRPPPAAPAQAVPFLQIHGNVLYNLNYYSRIDTPYSERDIYQHTIQTWLDVLVKGQYPFRIYLTNHFSNSPLFRNYSDLNFSYNNNSFSQQLKDQVRRLFLQSLPSSRMLDSLQRVLNGDFQKLQGLNGWMKNPALVQKMVEARELSLHKGASGKDSSGVSTSAAFSDPLPEGREDAASIDSVYASRKREADSLRKEIAGLQQLLQTTHQRSTAEVDQTLQSIQGARNPAQLQKELQTLGLSDSSLPKGYKTLMAIKSFNLGRTVVNYSELSAKNISVNGVQAEYNPSMYYAVASGSVDYRFRDFLIQSPGQPKQYLNIFRIGKGLKDGNSVILTYYTGRRQLNNAATTDSPAVSVPSSSLMGMTLEGNYRVNRNILLTGEVAKSSSPSYAGDSTKGHSLSSQLFKMNDRSNEAWSIKAAGYFPLTDTRVKASYKHLAANFQSFSIFTDGSSQSAWSVNVDQLFFRRQLDIVLGANTNDFSNPLISQEYSSKTVFKSVQATLRKRNWPVISLGYFPSSQITKLGNSQYIENYFYNLVGNVTHSYHVNHLLMNTAVVYTQFYNRASDSGFTYFNTRNLMLSQSLFLGRLTLQCNATGSSNQDYNLYTLEGKAQHALSQVLTIGAGIKYNKQTTYNIEQFGYSAELGLRLKRLGQIQFSADKGFIPGMNKVLVPDNTGRLTYYKTF